MSIGPDFSFGGESGPTVSVTCGHLLGPFEGAYADASWVQLSFRINNRFMGDGAVADATNYLNRNPYSEEPDLTRILANDTMGVPASVCPLNVAILSPS